MNRVFQQPCLNVSNRETVGSELPKQPAFPSEAAVSVRESDPPKTEGRPGVLTTDEKTWRKHKEPPEEIFGRATGRVHALHLQTEVLECASAEGPSRRTSTPEED